VALPLPHHVLDGENRVYEVLPFSIEKLWKLFSFLATVLKTFIHFI